jgi:ABC-type spermidine/putrescine transport system permease subunit II
LLFIDDALNLVFGRRLRQSLGRTLLWATAWAVLLFLLLPILIVIPVSLTGADFLEFPPSSLSLRWYAAYFNDPLWIAATWRSVRVGVAAALLSTILGGMAAFAFNRARLIGADLIAGLVLSPMILPRMVIAVAIFRIYSEFGLVGTDIGLIIAHTTLGIPVAMISIATALQNFDLRLEQAAATMGANRRSTLRKVTLPIIKTGVFSALLFSFVVSFDELILALFITGGTGATLPRKMWDEIYLQVTPTLAAVSTPIILCVVIAGLAGQFIKNRSKQPDKL